MKKFRLLIKTPTKNYPILIGNNITNNLKATLNQNKITINKCLFFIDKNLNKQKLKEIIQPFKNNSKIIYFNPSEKSKNFKTVIQTLDILQKTDFNRNDYLIAIGGGITGDTGGFVASLFKRGMKFINIPTTLLAQVDSSVGGKTGVNTAYGKNLVGSFYQPEIVISDTSFLRSLPKRELICGYGEILKHSIIQNKSFFKFLDSKANLIFRLKSPFIEKAILESCKIKQNVVQKDERENGVRKILNFGHTFAHAYEASLNYSKKLNHGEAVLLGMISALNFSKQLKILKKNDYDLILNHYSKMNLPSNIKQYFKKRDINKLIRFMQNDKKNMSKDINLILLNSIGKVNHKNKFKVDKLKNFFNKELNN
ncbi:3-dehydroquinate synthase [Candidatus Pelagibacter sp.]|uniref:3-dehydroquinate synthase n=1 Tax=Candidatus Pelagibacter sp. TaxID=2024849 RepID=UPI003F84667B